MKYWEISQKKKQLSHSKKMPLFNAFVKTYIAQVIEKNAIRTGWLELKLRLKNGNVKRT